MSKHWLVIVCITLLSGCYAAGKLAQGAVGLSKDRCGSWHPVFATVWNCRFEEPYDNFGVTQSNANDIVYQECLLIHAMRMGRFDVFDTLLKYGADPKNCGDNYQTFFTRFVVGGCPSEAFKQRIAQLGIPQTQSPKELLEMALQGRCPDGAAYAVGLGADPNEPREIGYLPLDAAVGLGTDDIALADMLIKLGADPHIVSPHFNLSPYQRAVQKYSGLTPDSSWKGKPYPNWPLLEKALLQNAAPNL